MLHAAWRKTYEKKQNTKHMKRNKNTGKRTIGMIDRYDRYDR
jgi:hypothetical protein